MSLEFQHDLDAKFSRENHRDFPIYDKILIS